jgi:hypothetical protein
MSNELTEQSAEAAQIDAMAGMPPNMALLKMENEQIFAVAKAQPRDPMKIVGQLQQLIDAYPAAADEAIYSKPVGTVTEVVCPNSKCGIRYEVNQLNQETACPACETKPIGKQGLQTRKVKKFAEGLSIRAAESIRSIYGFTRLATTMETVEDDKVRITGTLVDYSAGNLTSDERVVSPWYKARGGGMTKTPEDRFYNVVVKAEKSKLRRDIILDNTPGIVKALFRDACEQKMRDLVAPEVIKQKVIPAFAEYGITPEHLDKLVGKPAKLGWNEEERLGLRKILNALKNEETTARELLDGLEDKPRSTVPDSGASIDDVLPPEKTEPPSALQRPPLSVLNEELQKCTLKRECEFIKAQYPDDPAVAAICDERWAEIKGQRGEASNKPKAEEPAAEEDPLVAASAKRRDADLAAIQKATFEQQVVDIENAAIVAQGTGDLLPADCEAVTSACRRWFKNREGD